MEWLDIDWTVAWRIVVSGVVGYAALIVSLRLAGKRSLAKWNAHDFIVTVALGSTLATGFLSQSVPVTGAVIGAAGLLLLQFIATWLSVRWRGFEQLIKSRPAIVVFDGRMQTDTMRHERLTEAEVCAAARTHGLGSLDDVAAMVLEAGGELTVITRDRYADGRTLHDVDGWSELEDERRRLARPVEREG